MEERTKWKLVAWSAFSILAFPILLVVIRQFGQGPPIRISRQTTRITSPLGTDGLPDYVAYFRQRMEAGNTPENNGAALFWRAMWRTQWNHEDAVVMSRALGIQIPTADERLLVTDREPVRNRVADWLKQKLDSDSESAMFEGLVFEFTAQSQERPWTSQQNPVLAEWTRNNERPLDLLVECANRPRFYSPTPGLLTGDDLAVISLEQDVPDVFRGAVRSLSCRAMWHLGEGRTKQAWRDILACHRIAEHCSRGVTLVDQCRSIAVTMIASRATQTLLHHGHPNSEDARQILADLRSLRLPSVDNSIDDYERFVVLDTAMRLSKVKYFDESGDQLGIGLRPLLSLRIDWNATTKGINTWFDRLVEICKLPRLDRIAELKKLNSKRQRFRFEVQSGSFAKRLLNTESRSQLAADFLVYMHWPAAEFVTNGVDRAATTAELTRLCAALAVYRTEKGEYPESLEHLPPCIISELPIDLYSGEPMRYRRQGAAFVLYSVFLNGIDDGANDNTDWVVLLPRPVFEDPPLRL